MLHRLLCVLIPIATAAACSDDPVSYSAPVGISLGVTSADVATGTLTDEKNVNTESGNPYAEYIQAARDELGRDPGTIEIESATLELLGTSTNVTALGEVFDGDVDLAFVMNSSDSSYPATVATLDGETGAGPIDMHSHFDPAAITDEDWPSFVGGSFKVVLTGAAASGFEAADATAELQATFTFVAYE
jgi:hypothetical protein